LPAQESQLLPATVADSAAAQQQAAQAVAAAAAAVITRAAQVAQEQHHPCKDSQEVPAEVLVILPALVVVLVQSVAQQECHLQAAQAYRQASQGQQ
jgi:hypothetical protein